MVALYIMLALRIITYHSNICDEIKTIRFINVINNNYPQDSLITNKTDSLISFINHNINSYKEYNTDVDNSTERGVKKIWYNNQKEIVKTKEIDYGETGKRISEFYFVNKILIFAIDSLVSYKVPISINKKVQFEKINIDKYYFSKNRLCLWKNNQGIIDKKKYGKKENEIMEEVNELLHQ